MSTVTPQSPKQSVRKQAAGALERIAEVEKNIMMLTSVLNRSFGGFQQQQSSLTEVVDAIVSILGVDNISNAVNVARQEKATQQAEQAEQRRASVADAVAKGTLVPETVIRPAIVKAGAEGEQESVVDAGSTVASVMLDKAGEEMPGTYYVMPMSQVKPEFRAQLEGKEVGYTITNEEPVLDDKGQPVMLDGKPTMAPVNAAKILGIYKAVAPKAPEASAATESSSVQ